MVKFKDKIAIITGGAAGIGKSLCLQLSSLGAIIVTADIDVKGVNITADEINNSNGRAIALNVDVSKEEDIRKLINKTLEQHGRIDYMFNNAGIHLLGEARDMNSKQWRRIVDVNLWSVIWGATMAYDVMLKQGFGHIVNTASLSGIYPSPFETAYATTKFGIVGLSTSLREEAKAFGVNVSVVCPAIVKTNIFASTTLVKIDRKDIYAQDLVKKAPQVDDVVKTALKGVTRNKAIIPVPLSAAIIWRLYRLFPKLALIANKGKINLGRKLRNDYDSRNENKL